MMRNLLHFGHRSASRLVTQAAFGCSWAAALLCAPLLVAAGWQGATVTLLGVAFLNLHFLLPLKRPQVDVTHTTISTIHRAIRRGTPYTLPNASTTVLGGVLATGPQADSVATDVETLVDDFNALLAKLRSAGSLVTT